jgi:hypothetical protein
MDSIRLPVAKLLPGSTLLVIGAPVPRHPLGHQAAQAGKGSEVHGSDKGLIGAHVIENLLPRGDGLAELVIDGRAPFGVRYVNGMNVHIGKVEETLPTR